MLNSKTLLQISWHIYIFTIRLLTTAFTYAEI